MYRTGDDVHQYDAGSDGEHQLREEREHKPEPGVAEEQQHEQERHECQPRKQEDESEQWIRFLTNPARIESTRLAVDGTSLNDGPAEITATDIEASNGVIHGIDGVLLPE